MNRPQVLQILNVLAFLAMVVVNYLANALPFDGKTTGDVSNQFTVLFKPAGYVFAIWGLIYFSLLAFALYQALPSQRSRGYISRIGYWFIVSCAANICWLFAWHHERFAITVLLMLMLLFSLIRIYLNLEIGSPNLSNYEKWLVHRPFSLYLGWVSVATIANLTIYLTAIGWRGWGVDQPLWFAAIAAVGLLLSLAMAVSRSDTVFTLVFLWAYAGIAIQNAGIETVSVMTWSSAGLAVVPVIVSLIKRVY